MSLIINDLKQKKIHLVSARAWQGRGGRESTTKYLPVISRPLQSILCLGLRLTTELPVPGEH